MFDISAERRLKGMAQPIFAATNISIMPRGQPVQSLEKRGKSLLDLPDHHYPSSQKLVAILSMRSVPGRKLMCANGLVFVRVNGFDSASQRSRLLKQFELQLLG